MEGSVKERLTGALILVAAMVIIVPEMLLSGPDPEPAGSTVKPQQPEAGPPLRTYSMVLNDSGDSRAAAQAPIAQPVIPEPQAAAIEPAAVPVTVEQAPAVAERPAAAQPVSDAPAAAGSWWAQLGSFSARDNAERLTRQLGAAGFAIDMSKVSAGGKELYRVRAGPVRSRGEALELQSRLNAAGHKSAIVPP